MDNPATTADITSRWRPLTPAETTVAQTRLDDAWRKLKRVRGLSTLETRMVADPDLVLDVRRVLADAVIRLLQSNSRDGLRKGAVGVDDATTSWELDASIQTGLYFTDDEIADLQPASTTGRPQAFSVQPS